MKQTRIMAKAILISAPPAEHCPYYISRQERHVSGTWTRAGGVRHFTENILKC